MPIYKKCSSCKEIKPVEKFYRCKKYGRQCKCKECQTAYTLEYNDRKRKEFEEKYY